jgi:uncharacterized integral membrane protein (TIGR00698 family)
METAPTNPKFILMWLLAAVCCLPAITPPIGLLIGLVFALVIGNPIPMLTGKLQKYLLQVSVVGLGFGIQLQAVIKAGTTGMGATAVSLLVTMLVGWLLARMLTVDKVTGQLVSTGTAICGGSAIAAMAPVVGATTQQTSVALGCIFILNAVALFLFPAIGTWTHMSQAHFGYWSAIAIFDTSSVVGAAQKYGADALAIAVPVKLARALWILPMVAVAALIGRRKDSKAVIPWFVFFFLLASVIATVVPSGTPVWKDIANWAKTGLTVTLFLIGATLSRKALKEVGFKPMLFTVALWAVISIASFAAVGWLSGGS